MKKWAQPGTMLHYATLGVEMVAILCVFLGIGWYIDRRCGGGVGFTLAGAVVGLAGGFYRMCRVAGLHRELKDDDEPEERV